SLSNGSTLNAPFKGNDEIAELDQSLYKSATEIRQLEKFKNEMVGVVSHELKSPLSSVGGFLASLGAGVYGELSVKAQDKVDRTYNSVKRLMGLVGELLYIDRLELEMHPEEIHVDELLAASVDTVKELSETSGIEIEVMSSGGSLIADRNRLVQVIVNLLSNAMKFSPKDAVIKLETQFTDGWFECRVIDQGPGIPESFRKQIFEPFKQVDATDATTKKGTGLGLTISRSIVEQHGGQIAVDSELGKGSTFWFKLPLSAAGNQAAAKSGDRTQIASASKPSMLPSTTSSTGKAKTPSGKYGVLKQGVVIIALPLVFQICFALIFNNMINGICNQIEQEHNSMKVLQSLNNCINVVTSSSMAAIANVYFQNQPSTYGFEQLEKDGLAYLDSAIQLSSKNPAQIAEFEKSKEQVKALADLFRQESITHESKNAFDKMDFAYRQKAYESVGLELKPSNASEARDAEEGIGGLEMLAAFRELWKDPIHKNLWKFLKMQTYLEAAMDKELDISQRASRQRHIMIREMENTLVSGIVATVVISVLIALFLMRGITNRLQHVMLNTHLLVKREKLDAPIKGNDEIAYLDNVLFETGNRLIELEIFKRELVSIV
ncbi:MAG: HAMP domain-containing histidine kinase, partial [Candidatus Obscuribacterales bacterium]|nr:HAMP domain-containing histidine kinase [Candidatus Obscuribacterales bacterium]